MNTADAQPHATVVVIMSLQPRSRHRGWGGLGLRTRLLPVYSRDYYGDIELNMSSHARV